MKLLVTVIVLGLLGGVAHAQESSGGEYHSPLRANWREEVKKDPGLKADIEDALRLAVHQQEADTVTRNNQHVVMAYIAIWVLTAGFLLATFLRQGKLKDEIARLRAELEKTRAT